MVCKIYIRVRRVKCKFIRKMDCHSKESHTIYSLKIRQGKQQRLTKCYLLQITWRNDNRTIESSTPPTSDKKQPSIIIFLQPKYKKGTKERSAQNGRKERTINHAPRIVVTNHTYLNPHSFIPKKPFQTHLNYPLNFTRQQPRNKYHPDNAAPLKNQKYRAIANPYLANIVPQRHDISSNKSPPNLISSPKTMLQA